MSDDIEDDDIPEEVKAIVKALEAASGGSAKIVPIAMGKIPKGMSPETHSKMLAEALAKFTGGTVTEGDALEIRPKHTLVLTNMAEFDSGSVRNSIHPDRVAPSLLAKIPLPEGVQEVSIEFADPAVLYKLLDTLMTMVVGYAYEDHAEILKKIATKEKAAGISSEDTLN